MNALRCRRLIRYLSDYIDGTIDASVCEHLEKHVEDCAPCKVFIRNFRKTVKILRAQGRGGAPTALKRRLRASLRRCLKAA